MTEPVYDKLADALDMRTGMPFPKIQELLAILEFLYTPQEAELASKMPLNPVPAEVLARDIGSAPREVESILEGMADKGLVFPYDKPGVGRLYNLMALLPGVFEIQFIKGDINDRAKKMARLFQDYFDIIRQPGATATRSYTTVPFSRVIAVETEIPAGVEIHPYDKVTEYITMSDHIAVGTCYCRHHAELMGDTCDRPKDVCMSFGPGAKFFAERGFSKLVSKEEALQILDRAEKAGLVHCSSNTSKSIGFICNCCSCHCGIMASIKNAASPSMAATSSFILSVDEEMCMGCGDCVDRCQVDAITMEGEIVVRDVERCIGCGLCVSTCAVEALKLVPKEEAPVPPVNQQELGVAMIASRQQSI